jgi:metal-responsive CopG/Arc/MetJ family transcriptional regulator
MTRKKKQRPHNLITFYLDDTLLEHLDRVAEKLKGTRTDAIRYMLMCTDIVMDNERLSRKLEKSGAI